MEERFIPQEFDVRKPISKDADISQITGLEEIVKDFLGVPLSECEPSPRDFGLIIKKPNEITKLPVGLDVSFGTQTQTMVEALKKDEAYVISELILALNPNSATAMMSHEGEVYELVKVLHGELDFAHQSESQIHIWDYSAGHMFLSVRPGQNLQLPIGFYHQLKNPNMELAVAYIMTIAEKKMGFKDGKPLKYGLNRPPNTYTSKS
jgi:hypothetical protein